MLTPQDWIEPIVVMNFDDLQTMLKALFPGAAGRIINEERVIPQLPSEYCIRNGDTALSQVACKP